MLDDRGQALLEYILSLLIVIVVIGGFSFALRRPVGRLWQTLTREVAAPCPGCPGAESVRF